MKTLLRYVVVLIIFLAGAELGITYYVAGLVEQKFKDMEIFLNENEFLSSELVSFNKGLYASEAVTRITIKGDSSNKHIKIKHTIYNGPVIIGSTPGNLLALQYQLAVIDSHPIDLPPTVKMPFVTRTVFLYNGEVDSKTKGEAFNIQLPAIQVSGSAWTICSQVPKDWLTIKSDIHFPSIDIQALGMAFQINQVSLSFDQKRSKFGNWLGMIALNIGNASQKNVFDVDGLSFNENSTLREQVIDFVWKIDLNKAVYLRENYGPNHITFKAMNIDPEAINALAKMGLDGKAPNQEQFYQKLLLRRPKIQIEPSQITLPAGVVHFNAELNIGGHDIKLPLDLNQIQQTVDGNLFWSAPNVLVRQGLSMGLAAELAKDPNYQKLDDAAKKTTLDEQIDLKIKRLIDDGILTEKDQIFELKLTMEKGQWIVNGKPIEKSLTAIEQPVVAPVTPTPATAPASGTTPAPVGSAPAGSPAPQTASPPVNTNNQPAPSSTAPLPIKSKVQTIQ